MITLTPNKSTPGRPFNWTATLDAAEALRLIVVEWWAPAGPGVNAIVSTAGRVYLHEFERWLADPIVTEIHPYRLDFPTLQDYPDPKPGAVTLAPVSGELEI
jgi:hypothetical protein